MAAFCVRPRIARRHRLVATGAVNPLRAFGTLAEVGIAWRVRSRAVSGGDLTIWLLSNPFYGKDS